MTVQIENEFLIATFAEEGAELVSLQSKETGIEYIWQGNPEFRPPCARTFSDCRSSKRRYVYVPKSSVSFNSTWFCS